jgi:hypothetical protein
MQSNTANQKKHRVTVAPVTTMEELPILTPAERAEFIDTLEDAQAQIKAGNFMEYEPEAFKNWLSDRGDPALSIGSCRPTTNG